MASPPRLERLRRTGLAPKWRSPIGEQVSSESTNAHKQNLG
jgi:hypothetical protein